MRLIREWWLTVAMILWLSFVRYVAGAPAAFFTAVTSLFLLIVVLMEVGKKEMEREAARLQEGDTQ